MKTRVCMRQSVIALLITPAIFCGILSAQESTKIKKVPLSRTSPVSGKEMFTTYCSACHGKDGTGAGPAAAALKTPPTDLTRLAIRNNGKFPEERVMESINGPDQITAHGSREMPVWGDLFKSINSDPAMVRLRVTNLTAHIQSIQRK